MYVAGEQGFEPQISRPERDVLPLHHSPRRRVFYHLIENYSEKSSRFWGDDFLLSLAFTRQAGSICCALRGGYYPPYRGRSEALWTPPVSQRNRRVRREQSERVQECSAFIKVHPIQVLPQKEQERDQPRQNIDG